MALFDRFFGKKKTVEPMNHRNSQYSILPIEQNEINYIWDCADCMAKWFKTFNVNYEKSNIFHPVNIEQFAIDWFYNGLKEESGAFIDDDTMWDCLGSALGVYAEKALGMKWFNISDRKYVVDGNIPTEFALYEGDSETYFFPFRIIKTTIKQNRKGLMLAIFESTAKHIDPYFELFAPESEPLKETPDFDTLANNVKLDNDISNLDILYSALFNLDEWIFIATPKEEIDNTTPFIGILEEKPWFFVFTDANKALQFTKNKEMFKNEEGKTIQIKMSAYDAVETIFEAHKAGVYGVRFNEGDTGWVTPIDSFPAIIRHLKEKRLI